MPPMEHKREPRDELGRLKHGVQCLTPEQEAKRARSISLQRKGTHGYGLTARDNPRHCKAVKWTLRDPRGIEHSFTNLQAWARQNESRFRPDPNSNSRLPLWRRFVLGINGLRRTDGKAGHHYRGWTIELHEGFHDVLCRGMRK